MTKGTYAPPGVVVTDVGRPHFSRAELEKGTPKFEHDCGHCTFLGYDEGRDFYVCPQPGLNYWTMVMRWGDRGDEYDSIPVDMIRSLGANLPIHPSRIVIAELRPYLDELRPFLGQENNRATGGAVGAKLMSWLHWAKGDGMLIPVERFEAHPVDDQLLLEVEWERRS